MKSIALTKRNKMLFATCRKRLITLIGATTENPSLVITPLPHEAGVGFAAARQN